MDERIKIKPKKLRYIILDGLTGEEDEYATLEELLDQWANCYFLKSCEAFIEWTTEEGTFLVPVPRVDGHDGAPGPHWEKKD